VGECDQMKKEIYLPVLGLVAGELAMFSGHVYIGLAIYIINLQSVTLALIFGNFSNGEQKHSPEPDLAPSDANYKPCDAHVLYHNTAMVPTRIWGHVHTCILYHQEPADIIKGIGIDYRRLVFIPARSNFNRHLDGADRVPRAASRSSYN